MFETLRLSLAYAIQHGLIAVLVFCGAIILATFFLKDIPIAQQTGEAPDEAGAIEEREEDVSMVVDEALVNLEVSCCFDGPSTLFANKRLPELLERMHCECDPVS